MANIKSAKKRAIQSEQRREHNVGMDSAFRTCVKKIEHLITANDKDGAQDLYRKSVSMLDSYVHTGLAHRNKVARCKSRLNSKIRAMPIAK